MRERGGGFIHRLGEIARYEVPDKLPVSVIFRTLSFQPLLEKPISVGDS